MAKYSIFDCKIFDMEDFLGYNIECIRPPERLGWGILFIRFPSQVFDMEDLAGSAKSSKGCESEISKPEKCNILGLPSQAFDMEGLAGEAKQNNPPAKAAEQKCSTWRKFAALQNICQPNAESRAPSSKGARTRWF